jgi:hypothetical protein
MKKQKSYRWGFTFFTMCGKIIVYFIVSRKDNAEVR